MNLDQIKLNHSDVSSLISLIEAVAAKPEDAGTFAKDVAASFKRRDRQVFSLVIEAFASKIEDFEIEDREAATYRFVAGLRSM